MKCEICGKSIENMKDSHNGEPLVRGRVCSDCNWKVIKARLKKVRESELEEKRKTSIAEESMSVIGTEPPIGSIDPMADFEAYAKKFEEMFILSDTPVRKEVSVNNVKPQPEGESKGEVISLEKSEKADNSLGKELKNLIKDIRSGKIKEISLVGDKLENLFKED